MSSFPEAGNLFPMKYTMPKKYSKKFWITFIAISIVFLGAWFLFWEVQTHGVASLKALFGILPIQEEKRTDLGTIATIAESLLHTDGATRTYLILFQNSLELRPGGGFIGSFGILKIKDGAILHFSVHDTGNFDGRIPSTVEPPYPMRETLRINSWKLRDSNYSPDFHENAKWAETFYQLGQCHPGSRVPGRAGIPYAGYRVRRAQIGDGDAGSRDTASCQGAVASEE